MHTQLAETMRRSPSSSASAARAFQWRRDPTMSAQHGNGAPCGTRNPGEDSLESQQFVLEDCMFASRESALPLSWTVDLSAARLPPQRYGLANIAPMDSRRPEIMVRLPPIMSDEKAAQKM